MAQMAANSRFTKSSLYGIILDIHLLSRSDFLVCTFSSNVCRLAYEIMQSLDQNVSDGVIEPHNRCKSVDDAYYLYV